MPSRSATSCLIGVALIFVVLTLCSRTAYAGSYDVYAWDGAVGGGANNAFYAVADVGMTAYTQCLTPQGLVARNSYHARKPATRVASDNCIAMSNWLAKL
jgi:hypothetical protein